MDASAPYYDYSIQKYLCTLKLIDDTVHPGMGGLAVNQEYFTATMFARTYDELPLPTKIGSILRIHRGQTKPYTGEFQLNCDVNIKGAWALFDPAEGNQPISHTGRKYTFINKDTARLKDIREFSYLFFSRNEYPRYITLKDAEKKPEDFDTICLVLEIKKKGDLEKIKVCDNGKVVKFEIELKKSPSISPQDIIRIRSANYGDKKMFKTLTFSEHSNLIRIPKDFKLAKNFLDSLENRKVEEHVKSQLELYTPQVGAPLILGEIKETHRSKKIVALKELFSGAINSKTGYKARVRASVLEVGPKDPHGWLLVYNKRTHET